MKLNGNKTFNRPMLTDGGLETTLIFHHGIDLPHFAAFELLNKPAYRSVVMDYYKPYLTLAKKYHTGFILESATWRANPDWAYRMGYTQKELIDINQLAIRQLQTLKEAYQDDVVPMIISGCIGPRSDGYKVGQKMSVAEAQDYHHLQIAAFKEAGADITSAMTINYVEEAQGIVAAAKEMELSVVISFTVETDGNLPSGMSLREAIEKTDRDSNNYPSHYMINCAHPSHFAHQLNFDATWTGRIAGIRANASCKSHAELDEAVELDTGDKEDLANWYITLQNKLPNLQVYGGCCGTDDSHIALICDRVLH